MRKLRKLMLSTSIWLGALLSACSAKPEPPPTEQPPVGDVCSATTPICTLPCGAGFECRFADGVCGCVDLTPTAICEADAPVCDTECGTGFTCTFVAGACACTQDMAPID